ncbi:MAG: RagB/SusD family nutrient uptake outer membrane protein [Tannerella sp.]|jgi:hypothetical protein|nr:RagB/SusD family nutrient uptake outer membrane protein [Tannerella sp.]
MKRILYPLLSFMLFACNDLDVIPLDTLTGSNFLKSDEDAVAAVNGVYNPYVYLSSTLTYIIDGASDATISGEANLGGGGPDMASLTYDAANSYVYTAWSTFYTGITNANALIEALSASDTGVTEPLRSRLLGEARFLRALYYFYLVQLYGDVPLILHGDEGISATRNTVNEVYTQIVSDLGDATSALPLAYASGDDKGRATQGAAYALLAKVNLVWAQTPGVNSPAEKYQASVAAADAVQGYRLAPVYTDNWNKSLRDGVENIFSQHHLQGLAGSGDGGNHQSHCAFATTFSDETPHLVVTDISFYDRFDDSDQRKAGSYLAEATNPENNQTTHYTLPRFRKYIDVDNLVASATSRDFDRTILRYADVLLIKAEALNELGRTTEAIIPVNQVRHRAYKVGDYADGTATVTVEDISYAAGISQYDLKRAIRRERYLEFVYEQNRWFDLVRWKVLVKTIKKVAPSKDQNKAGNIELKYYRFPIPQSQRDLNPDGLWQNWGYEGATVANPYAGSEYENANEDDGWN